MQLSFHLTLIKGNMVINSFVNTKESCTFHCSIAIFQLDANTTFLLCGFQMLVSGWI